MYTTIPTAGMERETWLKNPENRDWRLGCGGSLRIKPLCQCHERLPGQDLGGGYGYRPGVHAPGEGFGGVRGQAVHGGHRPEGAALQ